MIVLQDDMGSVITCRGFAHGMMTSRLVDRPCGIGFLDLTLYYKFLTCGVDDSRDVIDHDDNLALEFNTRAPHTFATAQKSTSQESDQDFTEPMTFTT